jgi:hypothetical protein
MKGAKRKARVRAYILSPVNGMVQIGRTVYCVLTGEKFSASMKGIKDYPYVYVKSGGWKGAEEALKLWNAGVLGKIDGVC